MVYWKHLNSFEATEGTALYKVQNYSLNQKQALDAVLLNGRSSPITLQSERSNLLSWRAGTSCFVTLPKEQMPVLCVSP